MSRFKVRILLAVCVYCLIFPCFALAIQPDVYEEDNSFSYASGILNAQVQHHNFHAAGDQDWVKFYAFNENDEGTYMITATNVGNRCNVVIELYYTDGVTLIEKWDDWLAGVGDDATITWKCTKNGIYYVKIRHFDPGVFGDGTEYDLEVTRVAGNDGIIKGVIKDKCSSQGISGVKITVSGNGITDTFINPFVGDYMISLIPNTSYTITFQAVGYEAFSATNVLVKSFQEFTGIDIPLEPLITPIYYRDSDGDGYGDPKNSIQLCVFLPQGYVTKAGDCNDANPAIHPTLSLPDVIAMLRIFAGINTDPPICLKDHRLEMSDVIHLLQIIAGLR